MGLKLSTTMQQIKSIVLKTLISVEPTINSNLQKGPTLRNNCFELYGFDVIIDANLKPWVLEVNVLPSLSSSSAFDKRIKTMLVSDALTLVGLRGYEKLKFNELSLVQQGLAPFQQSMTIENLIKMREQLTGSEPWTSDEVDLFLDLEEEFSRRGNFQRVYPLVSNVQYYE